LRQPQPALHLCERWKAPSCTVANAYRHSLHPHAEERSEQIANFESYLFNSFVTNQITGIAKLQTYFEKGPYRKVADRCRNADTRNTSSLCGDWRIY
jgi:hypothetical protein